MNQRALSDIHRKLKILHHAKETGNVSAACRYFGIVRETFYHWKRAYEKAGEKVLINSKSCPENPTIRVPQAIEEKVIYLRKTYHLGQQRISGYLARYLDIKVSPGGEQEGFYFDIAC